MALAGFVLVGLLISRPTLAHAESPLTPGERALFPIEPNEPESPPVNSEPPAERHLLEAAQMPHAEFDFGEHNIARPQNDVYHRGQWGVSYLTGFYGINLGPAPIPFSMLPEMVRFHRVFNDPRPDRLLRGSFEWIFELDTLPVVNGPASIVIGGSFLVRYNFRTDTMKRLVFYGQMGGGGMFTDAYMYRSMVLSTGFEFIIHWGIGFNYFLTDRLALTAEWSYLHFSNGGILLPNIGVNQMGGLIGLTYYFKRRKPI